MSSKYFVEAFKENVLDAVVEYLKRLDVIRSRWPEPECGPRVRGEPYFVYRRAHLTWRRIANRQVGMARTTLLKKLEEE